ncbi:MAG TPA: hypothetical protein VFK06_07585 [Candidatus Angelobacter sp.]|nr:hypothetical protein [Candidatus Angelobacter sp.]
MPEHIDAVDISDDDILWRRVDQSMIERNPDGTESLQSWAYKDQNHELSVHLARETTPQLVFAAGKPGQVLVGLRAQIIRSLGYKVVRDPEPDNSAHCLIIPYPTNKPHRKAMAAASVRVKI